MTEEDTQIAGYEVLSDGNFISLSTSKIHEEKQVPNKVIHAPTGTVHLPSHAEFGKELYANITRLVEEHGLKVSGMLVLFTLVISRIPFTVESC